MFSLENDLIDELYESIRLFLVDIVELLFGGEQQKISDKKLSNTIMLCRTGLLPSIRTELANTLA
jgi:hypothetical protein